MTRQELNFIIESNQPVTINAELMAAARENAHQLRSESIRQGVKVVSKKLSEYSRMPWHQKRKAYHKNNSCCAHATA